MIKIAQLLGCAVLGGLAATPAFSTDTPAEQAESDLRQFTFSWQFSEDDEMRPRGGTTKGSDVSLAREPNTAWEAIREPGISKQEQDRRAILAMAGGYRTSFEFIETVGFVDGYQPARPYQSWGTEYVYVVEDRPDFVSLQHIIVMFFKDEDGEIAGPAVVKHWRQDWQYEDRDLFVFAGHNTWQQQTLSRKEARGRWSQSVYQVDDSPRYQTTGRWEHDGNHSSWTSETTWRPLPRREFSVRDDYHALVGTNRHTITPTGWVHEADNLKLVLNEDGSPRRIDPYLAREIGLNRYERIVDFDFSAGDEYWRATGPFWAEVRSAWDETIAANKTVTLKKNVDGKSLFMQMFSQADAFAESNESGTPDARATIEQTLAQFTN